MRYKWLETDHEQTPRVFLNLDDPIRVTHPDAVPPGRRCGGGIVPPPEPSCAYVGELKRIDEVYDYNYGATGITDPFVRNQRDRFEADASFEGRYQNDDVSGTSIQGDGSTFGLAQKTTAFLPRLSLTYSPADNTTLYVQLAKGNNPAGVNTGALDRDVAAVSAAFPNVIDNDNDGTGDTGTMYEGLDFGPGRSFLQAGDVTGVGLELEATYLLSENLSFGLAASLIDITYDEGACSTYPIDFGVPPNATTAARSRLRCAVLVPVGESVTGTGEGTVRSAGRHQDGRSSDARIPSSPRKAANSSGDMEARRCFHRRRR